MNLRLIALLLMGMLLWPVAGLASDVKKKQDVVASIEKHRAELTALSDKIWGYAETPLRETRSSKTLADYAEQQGFEVKRGVAGMPTAFIASYGQGRPIIGILGEFDALPGISQKAQPVKEALEAGAAGHGCGHNLFGAASLGAANAIKELIAAGRLKGTIRFYGTPAEEAIGGKVYMAREGLFNDLDVCLAWHPDDHTHADTQSTQAVVTLTVEFKGKAAHAAADPWNGRSALAGLEFFTTGLNRMREFVRPSVRMHYTVIKGGDVPNVVPEYSKVLVWLRDSKRKGTEELLARVRKIAEGAALMAEVESRLTVEGGDYEMLVNLTGEKLIQANFEWLGPIKYTAEEQEFARQIQRVTGVEAKGLNGDIQPWEDPKPDPSGGSTDVADVSWIVPVLHLSVTTAPEGAPWHAWPVVACGGMSIGHKGLTQAAKALATTMVDLFESPEVVSKIQAEFKEKTKGQVYKPYIPDGPPPVPQQ
ncbi:MAG TPA: amidohydrolase [Blastocatellia bacterium]|nr:amidohydrolase [Blastocatellia bacterium]